MGSAPIQAISVPDGLMFNAIPANVDTSTFKNLQKFKGAASIQVTWSGLDQVDGVVQLYRANDPDGPWVIVTGEKVDLTSAASSAFIDFTVESGFYKLDYAKGNNTAGTITAVLHAKG